MMAQDKHKKIILIIIILSSFLVITGIVLQQNKTTKKNNIKKIKLQLNNKKYKQFDFNDAIILGYTDFSEFDVNVKNNSSKNYALLCFKVTLITDKKEKLEKYIYVQNLNAQSNIKIAVQYDEDTSNISDYEITEVSQKEAEQAGYKLYD